MQKRILHFVMRKNRNKKGLIFDHIPCFLFFMHFPTFCYIFPSSEPRRKCKTPCAGFRGFFAREKCISMQRKCRRRKEQKNPDFLPGEKWKNLRHEGFFRSEEEEIWSILFYLFIFQYRMGWDGKKPLLREKLLYGLKGHIGQKPGLNLAWYY